MIKKKILSLLLAFAMVIGILPFGEISAYAAEYKPDVRVERVIHTQTVEEVNGKITSKVGLEFRGSFVAGGATDFKITEVVIYRKSADGGIGEPFNLDIVGNPDTNMLNLDLGNEIISPGETLYPRVFYSYKDSLGDTKNSDTWSEKFLQDDSDYDGGVDLNNDQKEEIDVKMGSILSMDNINEIYNRYKGLDGKVQIARSEELKYKVTAKLDPLLDGADPKVEYINTYLVKDKSPVALTSPASEKLEPGKTNYEVKKIVPDNAELGTNEIVIGNKDINTWTSQIIYRPIEIKPAPSYEPSIGSISVNSGPVKGSTDKEGKNNTLVEIKGQNFEVKAGATPKLPRLFLIPQEDSSLEGETTWEKLIAANEATLYSSLGDLSSEPWKSLLSGNELDLNDVVYDGTKPWPEEGSGEVTVRGNRIVAELPASTVRGKRDLILINPNGKITRLQNAFEYKGRLQLGVSDSDPTIEDISDKSISISDIESTDNEDKGKKVVIKGENITPFGSDQVIVTIDGKRAEEVESREYKSDIRYQEIEFKLPKEDLFAGEKTIQIITKDRNGDNLGMNSYNWKYPEPTPEDSELFEYIDTQTSPVIYSIDSEEATPEMPLVLEGKGFKQGAKVWIEGAGESKEVSPSNIKLDGTRLSFNMPDLAYVGMKKVLVENPDRSRSNRVEIDYYEPIGLVSPKIESIEPSYTVKDQPGMRATITGTGFKEGLRVMFEGTSGGAQGLDVKVSDGGTKIDLIVPEYWGDEESKVKVINPDSGFSKEVIKFLYKDAKTRPKIEEVYNTATKDDTGSTLGDELIRIRVGPFIKIEDPEVKLPKVYFGLEEAEVVENDWTETTEGGTTFVTWELFVKSPSYSKATAVDVKIINPEAAAGIALKENGFTYKSSEPKITSAYRKDIALNGKDTIYIEGTGFMKSDTENYNTTNPENGEEIDMEVEVLFGKEHKTEDILGAKTTIDFDTFSVNYYSTPKVDGNIEVLKKEPFPQDGEGSGNVWGSLSDTEPLYVSIRTSGRANISEGLKVIKDRDKIKVSRQMSIDAKVLQGGTLIEVVTPPMLKLQTNVGITVTNRDLGSASWTGLEVKNPASKPRILDIDENSKKPNIDEETGETLSYRVESGPSGGREFSILIKEFLEGATISIGNQEYKKSTSESPEKGTYKVLSRQGDTAWVSIVPKEARPQDIGQQLPIIVSNPDGGSANSKTDMTVGTPPKSAYFIYRESSSTPKITKIEPDKGSAIGGENVTITGEGFKYPEVKVWFGNKEAIIDTSMPQSTTELNVLTPPSDAYGEVNVVVENTKEFGQSDPAIYTYTSAPVILEVKPSIVYSSGGEKVEIIGKGFQDGAKVTIDGKEVEVKFVDQFKLEIVSPAVVLPNGVDSVKKDVTVTNPDGGETTKKDGITFTRPFPMRPTGFKATPQHGRTMMLEWNKVNIIERYRLEISESENGPYRYLAEVSGGEYLARDLKPDTKYYFKLWALNEYGQSQGFATANNKTFTVAQDNQSGEFEDSTENKSEVVESGGNITINYAKNYSVEDYTHDFTDIKYSNYRTITLSIPASVVNTNKGTLTLKHRDFELKSAISMFKSPEKSYNSGDTLKVTITKLFDGEQATALRYAPAGYAAQKQGVKMEYTVGDGRNNITLKNLNGIYLTTYVDKASLSELAHYSYAPGESSLQKEQSNFSKVYSNTHKKEIYKLDSYIKRSGYYIPLGR